MWRVNAIALALCAVVAVCGASEECRLQADLLKDYGSTNVRPVLDDGDTVVGTVGYVFNSFYYCRRKNRLYAYMWEKREWKDAKMAWQPSEYGGVDRTRFGADQLWTPDFVSYSGDYVDVLPGHIDYPLLVFNTSLVIHIPSRKYTVPCTRDGSAVECTLKSGSWMFSTEELELKPNAKPMDTTHLQERTVANVTLVGEPSVHYETRKYDCCTELYGSIKVKFTLNVQD